MHRPLEELAELHVVHDISAIPIEGPVSTLCFMMCWWLRFFEMRSICLWDQRCQTKTTWETRATTRYEMQSRLTSVAFSMAVTTFVMRSCDMVNLSTRSAERMLSFWGGRAVDYLTWKCTDPCKKVTFLVERAFLHFHVSWWKGNKLV